ncbi:unnamed protein product [Blepharisma stoltei]|uniref:Uncharacterized protein n=1 Tax=Blepharisma stoltei TaxID=1481888 RepID=A0AAU9K9I1_9CILI|nr:unnamed protein product [Blepharisma stoltei]
MKAKEIFRRIGYKTVIIIKRSLIQCNWMILDHIFRACRLARRLIRYTKAILSQNTIGNYVKMVTLDKFCRF